VKTFQTRISIFGFFWLPKWDDFFFFDFSSYILKNKHLFTYVPKKWLSVVLLWSKTLYLSLKRPSLSTSLLKEKKKYWNNFCFLLYLSTSKLKKKHHLCGKIKMGNFFVMWLYKKKSLEPKNHNFCYFICHPGQNLMWQGATYHFYFIFASNFKFIAKIPLEPLDSYIINFSLYVSMTSLIRQITIWNLHVAKKKMFGDSC